MASEIETSAETGGSRKRLREEDLPELELRTYAPQRILGKGSFGQVYQARVVETGDTVAIKSISTSLTSAGGFQQADGHKEREVQILRELHGHPNIVALHGAFLSGVDGTEPKLNLVLEFLSDTLHRVLKHYNQINKSMEHYYIKLYQYQLLRGLAYAHGKGIVHVDIKPQNLLLDGGTHTLKICDWGTARRMALGGTAAAYACSRYYRAPELILGAISYTTAVDLWSAGCVLAEMMLMQPLFTGTDGINQLVEIVKVVGTPTVKDLQAMNPNYPLYEFRPHVSPLPWEKVLRGYAPREAVDLMEQTMRYNPAARLPPLHALMHRFFDTLRNDQRSAHRSLFTFCKSELDWCAQRERERLIPRWLAVSPAAKGGR